MNHKEQRATELKEKRPQAGYCGFYNRIIKRIIDFILSLVAAVAVTPIVFIIGIFIAIEDGFPVFYTPLRGGYQGKAFRIFKLRTMYKGADKMGGTTALNDPRITRTGKALRKLKLDELPQVYNVLLGSMSFIGPRPELLRYTEAYKGEEKIFLKCGRVLRTSAPLSSSALMKLSVRKMRMKCTKNMYLRRKTN